jgi:hypothetical protein
MPEYAHVYSGRIHAYSLIAKEKRRAGVSPGCACSLRLTPVGAARVDYLPVRTLVRPSTAAAVEATADSHAFAAAVGAGVENQLYTELPTLFTAGAAMYMVTITALSTTRISTVLKARRVLLLVFILQLRGLA